MLIRFTVLDLIMFYQKTNTADMLDVAVDYIKDLERQYKVSY